MAATKKSAKRSAKKRPAKGQAARKKSARSSSKRASTTKAKARQGLKAARAGLGTVLKAGGKTWRTLKSTTAQVVEEVKETLAGETSRTAKGRRAR